jgi:hypothetical protein
MMDCDDKIMMNFMQGEDNDVVDEEEHLTILASHLQLQADKPSNVFPTRGGSKLGIRNAKEV